MSIKKLVQLANTPLCDTSMTKYRVEFINVRTARIQ